MDIRAVMSEIGERLERIEGLRVRDHTVDRVATPMAFVDLPDDGDFDEAMAGGTDKAVLTIHVIPSRADAKTMVDQMAPFLGRGESSIKVAVDSTPTDRYTNAHWVVVTGFETDTETFGDIQYRVARFRVELAGPGNE